MLKILAVLFAARQRGVEDGAATPTGVCGVSVVAGGNARHGLGGGFAQNNPRPDVTGQFLICRNCHAAIELEQKAISDAIIKSSADVGFKVEGQTVEVVGLCAGCQGA